jgi:5-methylcytosine-specific restriction endonuclease McrA
MELCDYGCGQEAKFPFKNGKRCCSKSHRQCPASRRKTSAKMIGHKISKETKEKIRQSKLGIPRSEKTKQKIAISNTDHKVLKETREKIRLSLKGRIPWNKGKIDCYSKEANDKRINSLLGEKNPYWKGGYSLNGIPTYDSYKNKLGFAEKCRRNLKDKNILEVKCTYCGNWYIPTLSSISERVRALLGTNRGELRLYCSEKCKQSCSIYRQIKYPKGFKQTSSREVQPELRQMRFKLDNYTCQKCNKHQDELEVALHCHHIEGIRWEPLESADLDKCITVCEDCHKKIHKIEGCGYHDMRCPEENKGE